MTGEQSRASAVAIAELKTDVRNFRAEVKDDISELKDDVKWMRRTMIGVIVSLLVVAASVVFSAVGS